MRLAASTVATFGVLFHSSLASGSPLSGEHKNATEVYINDSNVQKRATARIDATLLKEFEYYAHYNAAAYCKQNQGKSGIKVSCGNARSCPRVQAANTSIIGTWKELGKTGCTGFVAVDHTAKANVLAIRGSVSAANWAADGRWGLVPCPQYGGQGSQCNDGYIAVWNDCKKPAMELMNKAMAKYPNYQAVVTGHSLGATAAVYAVADVRAKGKAAKLYTYGQPRAGNEQFSKWFSEQKGNYRITHTTDPICNAPPQGGPGGYRHISPEYWIKSGYGNENNIVVLEGLANKNGVASTSGMNILAHIGYFQRNMYKCVIGFI